MQILNLPQSALWVVFLTWYLTNRSHLSSLTLWPQCSYSKTMTHPKSGPLILFNKCLSSSSELVKHGAFLTRSKGLTKRMKTVQNKHKKPKQLTKSNNPFRRNFFLNLRVQKTLNSVEVSHLTKKTDYKANDGFKR